MSSIWVHDRKFTYTRLSLVHGEVEETAVAHFVVATAFGDKFLLAFYNHNTDGSVSVIKAVHHVLKHDNGVIE